MKNSFFLASLSVDTKMDGASELRDKLGKMAAEMTKVNPEDRPDAKKVVAMLEEIKLN